jgi:SNF2 family DNA or RNA helicase
LTGTPVRRGPQDLYAPLHLINDYIFSSYWEFVNKHCITIKDTFGITIEPRPKDVQSFKDMLKPYMIRRTKKEVLHELPPKTRQAIPIQMLPEQERIYNKLLTDMFYEDQGGSFIITPSKATLILRLRQLLVAPRLLGIDADSAALEALKEMAEEHFNAGRSIVVCTPFKEGVYCILEELEKLPGLSGHLYMIKGQQTAEEIHKTTQGFQQDKSVRKALVYTIKSGASFTAHSASTAFFVGYEWSAIDNLQAEDRIHRLGQTDPVNIYYFMHKNTIVDDMVMQKLDDKQMAANWILRPDEVLTEIKKILR